MNLTFLPLWVQKILYYVFGIHVYYHIAVLVNRKDIMYNINYCFFSQRFDVQVEKECDVELAKKIKNRYYQQGDDYFLCYIDKMYDTSPINIRINEVIKRYV